MPGMDGLALARHLRAARGAESLVLMLLSSVGASVPGGGRDEALAAVLPKPVKVSLLHDRLLETLGGGRAMDAVAAPAPPPGLPAPLRILLAEDNALNQTVALRLLERLGYRADVAANGHEVLECLEQAGYNVILMDVQMPEMDGLEASRAVCRRWPTGQRPRIIAMTAEAMQGDRELCLAAGMDDHLAKPVRLDELKRALDDCGPVAAPPAPAPETGGRREAIDRKVLDGLREDLGTSGVLHQVLTAFVDRAPVVLADLEDAAARGDREALAAAAHTFKGTSATLGARALSEQCAELERLARAGSLEDLPARVDALAAEVARASKAFRAEIAGAGA
jgi:CheY-like chemotaxis protein/HPt (histidine-containing phosphotransfer) domain-containing protein